MKADEHLSEMYWTGAFASSKLARSAWNQLKSSPVSRPATLPGRPRTSTEADRIRDELAAMGVVLKDTKDGTTWEIAR